MFRLENLADQMNVITSVVQGWTSSSPDVCLVSKDGHTLYTQRALLQLHSPLISTLLSSSPSSFLSSSLPTMSLPFSSSAILSLISLLATGVASSSQSFDLMELVVAAQVLGIKMDDIQVGSSAEGKNKPKAKEGKKPSLKNLQPDDNVQNGSTKCETEENSENVKVKMSIGVKSEFDFVTEAGVGKKGKTLFCKFCSQMFRNIGILEKHENGHAEGNEDGHASLSSFPCEVCKKEFSVKGRLNLHMRTHTGEKPFSCGYCEKHFNQAANMKRHISEMHSKEEFSCDHCENKFKNERYMREHKARLHQLGDAAEVLK